MSRWRTKNILWKKERRGWNSNRCHSCLLMVVLGPLECLKNLPVLSNKWALLGSGLAEPFFVCWVWLHSQTVMFKKTQCKWRKRGWSRDVAEVLDGLKGKKKCFPQESGLSRWWIPGGWAWRASGVRHKTTGYSLVVDYLVLWVNHFLNKTFISRTNSINLMKTMVMPFEFSLPFK